MKLIAIDLDGTLLSDEGTISNANITAIQEAQQQGHIVSIASGRSLPDTKEILRLSALDCPIIAGNGATSFHRGEQVHQLYMDQEIVKRIIPILRELQLYYEVYVDEGVLLEKDMENILWKELEQIGHDVAYTSKTLKQTIAIQHSQHGLQFVDQYEKVVPNYEGIYKIFVLSLFDEKRSQLQHFMESQGGISITSSGREKLEIAHPRASKGYALELMADHFDIPMENTIAIGDNFNDLSMFAAAGMSISMGNAEEEVKQQSTYTTLNYAEDGVAHGIRRYVLGEE
ncbi:MULTISPECIES: Cof-type HAD-IIB family hydrolase [Clostridia]|uniref:Cof-type HAD-IIB family hydrolase n=1 Tax=Clostridia TaxID=186801 RepID=UPI000EA32801|nr:MULTISPECIES: Cof-type HAD-IIB family hydrolase [Clostridia]NBJ70068.1 HAD family phosphatase [Roseburia sp. 1XD42-34]RKI77242.1 HAD family phosphatase [Clostridium sp. 1xD42-85]